MVGMECLPPPLAGRQYYFPTDRGLEKRIAERLEEIRRRKRQITSSNSASD
jgi:putative ATPase